MKAKKICDYSLYFFYRWVHLWTFSLTINIWWKGRRLVKCLTAYDLKSYDLCYCDFVSCQNALLDSFITILLGKYQLTIHSKSQELDALFHEVRATLEAKSISVYQIVSYLISLFPNLENELECCKSLQEVFNGIRTYTSLDNVSHLETIISNYELPKYSSILQLYHKSVEELYKKTHINGKIFFLVWVVAPLCN